MLTRVLRDEDMQRGAAPPRLDLTPYMDIIDTILEQSGAGGHLALGPGESQRTEKRRLSIAAKQRNLKLTWRKPRDGGLRFVLSNPGATPPDGRRRRGKK